MAFKTSREPDRAVSRLVDIARSGYLPHNVEQKVSMTPLRGRDGYRIDCESQGGAYHDTKVTIFVKEDPISGSHVDVVPYENTPGEEANNVAQELKRRYFSNDEF